MKVRYVVSGAWRVTKAVSDLFPFASMLLFVENRQAADDRIQDEKRADEEIQAEQAAIQEAMVRRLDVQAACIKRLTIIHSSLTPVRYMPRTSFARSVKGKGGRCSAPHYFETLPLKKLYSKDTLLSVRQPCP